MKSKSSSHASNPGTVLLLDEPDAHLEILRQRQIYNTITEVAREANSQIIAASHSEVILNEACDRDTVVAFLGRPHRIDDRSNSGQVAKALKSIGFEQYLHPRCLFPKRKNRPGNRRCLGPNRLGCLASKSDSINPVENLWKQIQTGLPSIGLIETFTNSRPSRIRTYDLRIRNPLLYPTEL